jgi:cobyrinic acid a,c-diamide synthase
MISMPRVIIAGVHSGAGKTSLTLGLVALLRRRGLRVQTFKVGPDYLDPTYLSMISGRPCYNLDGWMTHREYIRNLFLRAMADADIAVIEGVMGLFDGADPVSLDGSTAQIAEWLDAPVLLVANVHGMARSFAALVHGFATFDSRIQVKGVIANHCGSERHAEWLRMSVESASSIRMLGAVMRGSLPELSSRHLGLVSASPHTVSADLSAKLADALASVLDIDGILQMAQAASPWNGEIPQKTIVPSSCRLGIAYDEAFHFYYPDNLEALEQAGCELVKFSPLKDFDLPQRLDGLYLGGGYPEEFAAELSANVSMLEQIRKFKGKIYAECGGLMYLSEGIETKTGARYSQAGLLPTWVRMKKQRKVLGYVEVTMTEPTIWGEPGITLRGHEYHYSELLTQPDWKTAYAVKHRRSCDVVDEGFQHENVLASYVHLHFASHPEAIASIVSHLSQ